MPSDLEYRSTFKRSFRSFGPSSHAWICKDLKIQVRPFATRNAESRQHLGVSAGGKKRNKSSKFQVLF